MENNRVEAELLRLREKDERFNKIFSFEISTNKALQRERLRDYERIIAKFGNTLDPSERSTIRLLKSERRRLEKAGYPNRLVRWFKKIFINPVRRISLGRYYRKLEKANQVALFNQLNKIGLGEYYHKVEKVMKTGEGNFTIPISRHMKENEWMDHNLFFERNSSGEYNLVADKVRLIDESEPKKTSQQTFSVGDGTLVDEQEGYNLLNGRAVQKDGKWMMLDLNDRDTEGNYRIKEINSSFDLEESLRNLKMKEWVDKALREKLVADVKKGNRPQVTIGNKRYFVDANPQFKKMNIYDSKSQRLSVAELQSKRAVNQRQTQNNVKTKVPKSGGLRMA